MKYSWGEFSVARPERDYLEARRSTYTEEEEAQ